MQQEQPVALFEGEEENINWENKEPTKKKGLT